MPEERLRERVKGKIVFVGATLPRQDEAPVLGFGSGGMERRWGVEWHADAVNTLHRQVAIRPLPDWLQVLIIIALACAGAAYQAHAAFRGVRLLMVSVTALACPFACVYVYSQFLVLANVTYYLVALGVSYWWAGRVRRRMGL